MGVIDLTKYISNIVRIFRTDISDRQQLLIDEFNTMPTEAPGILTFILRAPNPGGTHILHEQDI